MTAIQEVFQQGQLAEAAYANFHNNSTNTVIADPELVKSALIAEHFSLLQAEDFILHWQVVDQFAETGFGGITDGNGFSATIFRSLDNPNQFTLAIRGSTLFVDFLEADFSLATGGVAIDQLLSMVNYVLRLQAGSNGFTRQVELLSASGATSPSLSSDFVAGVGPGIIPSQLTIAGHSLGGFLGQLFQRIFGSTGVFTFNALGLVRPNAPIFDQLTSLLGLHLGNFSSGIGENLVVPGEPAHIIGTVQGNPPLELFSETANEGPMDAHAIAPISDSLAVYSLVAAIDPVLNTSSGFATITNILKASNRISSNTLESVVSALGKLFGVANTTFTGSEFDGTGRDFLYVALRDIKEKLPNSGITLTVRDLTQFSATQLASIATDNVAYRYALRELNPFAVIGMDYQTLHNANGELDLYDPDKGTGTLTDMWIQDRAAMLSYVNDARLNDRTLGENMTASTGDVIYSAYDAPGGRVTVIPSGLFTATRFVTFGNSQNDILFGRGKDDHLYGGGGEDTIFGDNGNDYIEGNDGDDLALVGWDGDDIIHGGNGADKIYGYADNDQLFGDAGEDQIWGGQGVDRLYGGTGDDVLWGEAGGDWLYGDAGQDELHGGEGVNWLEGGEGFDTYIHSTAGDSGFDYVKDKDGQIVFDGTAIRGGARVTGTAFTSVDDRFQFNLVNGTLYINGAIAILNFQNGDLGISLSDNLVWDDGNHVTTTSGVFSFTNASFGQAAGSGGNVRIEVPENAMADRWFVAAGGGDDELFLNDDSNNSSLSGGAGRDHIVGSIGNDYINGDDLWDANIDQFVFANYDYDPESGRLKQLTAFTSLRDGQESPYIEGIYTDVGYFSPLDAYKLMLGITDQTDLSTHWDDVIEGGGGNDWIAAGAGSDQVFGNDGDDYLYDGEQVAGLRWPVPEIGYLYDLASKDDFLDGGAGNDLLYSEDGKDVLIGGEGNDYLEGGVYLDGGAGSDRLKAHLISGDYSVLLGGDDSDCIEGGNWIEAGDGDDFIVNGFDYIDCGRGDDTVVVNFFSPVEITDPEGVATLAIDTSTFGPSENFRATDLLLLQEDQDLIIQYVGSSINGRSLRITWRNWFSRESHDGDQFYLGGTYRVSGDRGPDASNEPFHLMVNGVTEIWGASAIADKVRQLVEGTEWDDSIALSAEAQAIQGQGGADELVGGNFGDMLDGGSGDDRLYGNDGDDWLIGGAGSDSLFGGAGADRLNGGGGNDFLYGGIGADFYSFDFRYGVDEIFDDGEVGETDIVRIDSVRPDNIRVRADGADLVLSISYSPDDQLRVRDWSNPAHRVEELWFGDGTVWTEAMLANLADFPANNAPTVANSITTQSATEDTTFNFTVPPNTFVDADAGDTLGYTASLADGAPLPAWLSFDSSTGTFHGTPANEDVGTLLLRVTATDAGGLSASDTFELAVANVNDAPIANVVVARSVQEGTPVLEPIAEAFRDPDLNDVLTFSAKLADGSLLPAWLTIDGMTGIVSGTPGPADIGYTNIEVTATDRDGLSASTFLALTVTPWPDLVLTGTAGADTLTGHSGNDTLDGLGGADVMIGGYGNDTYFVDNVNDLVTEQFDQGDDTVFSSVTFTLGPNLENLTLLGTRKINGTGNEQNNRLIGNSAANTLTGAAGDDFLDGGAGADILIGGTGNDIYAIDRAGDQIIENAGEGIDTVLSPVGFTLGTEIENLFLTGTAAVTGKGNTLANLLVGNAASNTLNGASGNDILQGMDGDDVLKNGSGATLFDGGAGADTLNGSGSRELFIGGAGDDTIITGKAADMIGFNAGDGRDIIISGGGTDNTVSLGGGIRYEDLAFSRMGNDLVLATGGSDQMTFSDWYLRKSKHSVLNLQVIAEAMSGYNPGGNDTLLDNKVETFDFAALATAFDTAGQVSGWALSNALLSAHLSGSDSAAIGGDLAYQYGTAGSLSGIGLVPAQDVINSAQFGSGAQGLRPIQELQQGQIRLS